MEEANALGQHVEPFVRRMIATADPEWLAVIAAHLERPSWMMTSAELILTHPSPPADLLDRVLGKLTEQNANFIEILTLRSQVPEETLRRLLCHRDLVVALWAAVGEWLANPRGYVRETLR